MTSEHCEVVLYLKKNRTEPKPRFFSENRTETDRTHQRPNRHSTIRPSNPSNLVITNRSFTITAPCLWNQLPLDLRLPATPDQTSILSLSSAVFHKRLKTHLFHLSFPPYQLPPSRTDIRTLTWLGSYPPFILSDYLTVS